MNYLSDDDLKNVKKELNTTSCGMAIVTPRTFQNNKRLRDLIVADMNAVIPVKFKFDMQQCSFESSLKLKTNSIPPELRYPPAVITKIEISAFVDCAVVLQAGHGSSIKWNVKGGEKRVEEVSIPIGMMLYSALDLTVETEPYTWTELKNKDICPTVLLYGIKLKENVYENIYYLPSQLISTCGVMECISCHKFDHFENNDPLTLELSSLNCFYENAQRRSRDWIDGFIVHPSNKIRKIIHAIVVAFYPIGLFKYIILWIIDFLPHFAHCVEEKEKMELIEQIYGVLDKRK